LFASLAAVAICCSAPALATGNDAATVTDGDTLRFGEQRVRLWGIDAPELHQRCPDRWLAGIEAARKMRELVKGRAIACENRGYDRYGRMIGLCRADGVDIQAAMVRAGMAWACVRYSSDYVSEEAAAKTEGLGACTPPDASRRGSGEDTTDSQRSRLPRGLGVGQTPSPRSEQDDSSECCRDRDQACQDAIPRVRKLVSSANVRGRP